ncbi:MAG: phage terminase large subunit [Candidatus Omnitrophota bacterium]
MNHQARILLSPARRKVAVCGRRFGKTALGLMAMAKGHGPRPGAFPGVLDGKRILWAAPTFMIASDIWREAKRALGEVIASKSEVEKRLETVNGGVLRVASTDDPTGIRGPGWDGAVLDEAAFMIPEAWREVIRPALADRQGWVLFITTPNGHNWFKDLFDQAGVEGGWERWQRPTSDNPLIPQGELDEARLDMGERAFAQEHGAQFVDVQGAEFSGAYFLDSIWFDEWPQTLAHKVVALDPSKGKNEKSDYSAFVMIGMGYDGKMYIDADIQRRDVWRIVEDGIDLYQRWGPQAFGVEVNQFQEVLAGVMEERAKARSLMLPLFAINNTENKRTRIRATLTPYLARGDFRFKRGSRGARLLVDQLRAFPLGQHDDGPDALEMGVRLMKGLFEGGGLAGRGRYNQEYAVA